jgi:hypothetical protein
MTQVRQSVVSVWGDQGLVEEQRQLERKAVSDALKVLDCHIEEVGVSWRKGMSCGHGHTLENDGYDS